MIKIKPLHTGSDGNLYILTCNNKYLLECGIDYKYIIKYLYENDTYISSFKGCFISHRHKDHSLAIKDINTYMPIYSCGEVLERVEGECKLLLPKNVYTFDDLQVMPINVNHGKTECYGYMFKDKDNSVLFVTDFFKFDDILKTPFDEIFIECNWTKELMDKCLLKSRGKHDETKYQRQYQTHCSLETLKLLFERSINLDKCKKITLIHPSKEVCDKKRALQELKYLYPNIDISFAKNVIEVQ